MFKYILIIALAYYFFRWRENKRLDTKKNNSHLRYDDKNVPDNRRSNGNEGKYIDIDYEEVKD